MRWAKIRPLNSSARFFEVFPSVGDYQRLPRDPTRPLKLGTAQDTWFPTWDDVRGLLCDSVALRGVDNGATTENFSNFQIAVSHEVFS